VVVVVVSGSSLSDVEVAEEVLLLTDLLPTVKKPSLSLLDKPSGEARNDEDKSST
jgi:hypothetical protein